MLDDLRRICDRIWEKIPQLYCLIHRYVIQRLANTTTKTIAITTTVPKLLTRRVVFRGSKNRYREAKQMVPQFPPGQFVMVYLVASFHPLPLVSLGHFGGFLARWHNFFSLILLSWDSTPSFITPKKNNKFGGGSSPFVFWRRRRRRKEHETRLEISSPDTFSASTLPPQTGHKLQHSTRAAGIRFFYSPSVSFSPPRLSRHIADCSAVKKPSIRPCSTARQKKIGGDKNRCLRPSKLM